MDSNHIEQQVLDVIHGIPYCCEFTKIPTILKDGFILIYDNEYSLLVMRYHKNDDVLIMCFNDGHDEIESFYISLVESLLLEQLSTSIKRAHDDS